MYERYRFSRRGIMLLLNTLAPRLDRETSRSHAIDGRLQLLTALRFYASGTVHHNHGDHHGVSKASASRIVRRVNRVLIRMKHDIIRFPTTPAEVAASQADFFAVSGMPRVVSAVDCTHVLLRGARYGDDAYIYVNRKRQKSINVQLMCTTRFKITNVVARWPGSTHDSRILTHSNIAADFEAGRKEGVIIGDSGYPLKPWLITPIQNPQTPAEYAYNRAHPRTRVFIEQVNGQIKAKFPCLAVGLRVAPKHACRTIVACAVLFNMAKEMGEPQDYFVQPPPDPADINDYQGQPGAVAIAVRDQIVQEFF
ncbi:putative nuclease HARBI1 [Strongylocentrotus purpuratus]|uniref:Putative nuclease HARBI1 n=1 Tax=Strongylocentrotus purpuratus TaxID=7668 RepID=A0A7M7PKL3_STRPU|nr:putative nuclease HARBI1 [Strongylocentrotus purpuratus]